MGRETISVVVTAWGLTNDPVKISVSVLSYVTFNTLNPYLTLWASRQERNTPLILY